MTPIAFIRILNRNKWYLFSVPLLVAMLVYILTRNQPDEYQTSSVVYTGMVSGYDLETGSGMSLDYQVINSGFDNLITTVRSNETLKAVILRLMVRSLCEEAAYEVLAAEEWYAELKARYAEEVESRCGTLLARMHRDAGKGGDEFLYRLLYDSEAQLALDKIESSLSVSRVGSSDLLKVSFTSSDPQFAFDFLNELNDSFIFRYQNIKQKEAGHVVAFFEEETSQSYQRLQTAVERMRVFGAENRVINYYEQTKAIANQKEAIDQQIQQATMRLESARSAAQDLEARIDAGSTLETAGTRLVELRKEYAQATARNLLETTAGGSGLDTEQALQVLGTEVSESVQALYDARYSKEGLVKTDLVAMWMEQIVAIAQIQASLEVLETRRAEVENTYDDFAPLGSELTTLEREVDVAESEYLELLNSLNQARVRQQNIEMSNSMEVLDAPTFPHEPKPSKMKVLMALAYMASMMMLLSVAVGTELLNNTLRSPHEAVDKTGMNLIGFMPENDGSSEPYMQEFQNRCMEIMSARVKTYLALNDSRDTQLICMVSANPGDGKSTVASHLHQSLIQSGRHVIKLSPSQAQGASGSLPSEHFSISERYAETHTIREMMRLPSGQKVAILMELPSFSTHEMPLHLLRSAACVIWVARADRLWGDLEKDTLNFMKDQVGVTPVLCLNRVDPERLEDSVGEVAKDRSKPRRVTKKVLKRNFS